MEGYIITETTQASPTREGPRANGEITAKEVRLIGADGENIGIVSIREAMRLANDADLDLIEISPNAAPPVCKILDLGKYRYEQQKKKAEADGNGIDPLTLALERSFGKLAEDAPNTNSRLEKIFNAETPAEENGENGVADKYSFTGTNESLIKLQRELEELTTEKTGDAAAAETGRETAADNNAQKEEADAPKADA